MRWVIFQICFRKSGVPRKGGGVPQNRVFPTLEETVILLIKILVESLEAKGLHKLLKY